MKNKFFYGWVVTAVTFIGIGLVNFLGISSFSLFVAPVIQGLGVSATAFLLCATMSSLGGIFGGIIGGKMLDTKGLRISGSAGAALLALGFVVLNFATSMPIFYVGYFIVGFATGTIGTTFINKMASKWFVKYRGTVVGVCLAGQSTFTFFLAPYIAGFIKTSGYSSAYLVFAGILVVVAILLAAFIRNDPKDMGLLPDGATEQAAAANSTVEATGLTDKEAMKTAAFWMIAIGYGFYALCTLGVVQTYNAHFQSKGFSPELAAVAVSTYGLVGIFARFGWGWISDKINYKIVQIIGSVILVFSIVYLSTVQDATNTTALYIFGFAFALGNGFSLALMVKYLGINFGTKAIGALSGYCYTSLMVCSLFSGPIAGMIKDATGSYQMAYFVFAGFAVAYTALVLLAKKPKAMEI